MTRDEILAMPAGDRMDELVAQGLGWKRVRFGRKYVWREPSGFMRRAWCPSSSWSDAGTLIDILAHAPLITVRMAAGWRGTQAEIEANDFFGPGPVPVVYYRAKADDPRLALCRASLLMAYAPAEFETI